METRAKVCCICGREVVIPLDGTSVKCECDAALYMSRSLNTGRRPEVSISEANLYERRAAGKEVLWSMPSVIRWE